MATTKKSTTKPKTAKSTKRTTTSKKRTVKRASAATTKKSVAAAKKPAAKSTKQDVVVTKSFAVKTEPAKKRSARTMLEKLNIWNWGMAALHAAQGVAVVLLSKDVLFPVTTDHLTLDSLASTDAPVLIPATRFLFDVNVAYIVAAFFFMSAIAHVSIASWYRKRYEANLAKGINTARWIEYSFSASTMIVAIAMIAGIYDISTLLMMFGLTAVMNLCGLVMERANQGKDKVDWTSFVVGSIAGIIPWVVYAIYVYGSAQFGEGGGPPTFVYAILVSIFLFFNVFALNMWLQYKKIGKWSDYLYGEKAYIVLSLVAKSALAWQVFAGSLRP